MIRIIKIYVGSILIDCLFSVCLLTFIILPINAATTPGIGNTTGGNLSNGASSALQGAPYTRVKELYDELMRNYDKRIRPRMRMSDIVNVSISFSVTGILSFDTASQIINIWGYFFIRWTDELMVWNPYLYDGISKMQFPINQIWTPTLLIASSVDGVTEINNDIDKVTCMPNGYMIWAPEGTYKVHCDVNIKYYPFDKQSCEVLVYVSDDFASEVDLVNPTADINYGYLRKNSAWKLENIGWKKQILSDVSMISFYVQLDRRRDFIVYTMIAPLVLLSVLNVGVFAVPVDSGEKGSIAVTIFLSYGVFISTISDELPHNSLNLSYMLIYILLLLLLSVVAVIYTYIQTFIYSRYANKTVNLGFPSLSVHMIKIAPKQELPKPTDEGDNINSSMDSNYNERKHGGLTWNELLRKVDICAFVFFFLVVAIATCIFFISLAIDGAKIHFVN